MVENLNDKKIYKRFLELEKLLNFESEYINLYEERSKKLQKFKNSVSWREYDDFLSSDNALSFFLMYYFYNKGLSDASQTNKLIK